MDEHDDMFDLVVECVHCGTENGVYLDDADLDTVEELSIGIEDTVCTDDAVDYIFTELTKDGFAPSTGAIRAVLRYFHSFIAENIKNEEENKE